MKKGLKAVNVDFELAQLQEIRTMGVASMSLGVNGDVGKYFEERLEQMKKLKELKAELILDIHYSICSLEEKIRNFSNPPPFLKNVMERCIKLRKQKIEFIFYFKKPKRFSWINFDGVLLFDGTLLLNVIHEEPLFN